MLPSRRLRHVSSAGSASCRRVHRAAACGLFARMRMSCHAVVSTARSSHTHSWARSAGSMHPFLGSSLQKGPTSALVGLHQGGPAPRRAAAGGNPACAAVAPPTTPCLPIQPFSRLVCRSSPFRAISCLASIAAWPQSAPIAAVTSRTSAARSDRPALWRPPSLFWYRLEASPPAAMRCAAAAAAAAAVAAAAAGGGNVVNLPPRKAPTSLGDPSILFSVSRSAIADPDKPRSREERREKQRWLTVDEEHAGAR